MPTVVGRRYTAVAVLVVMVLLIPTVVGAQAAVSPQTDEPLAPPSPAQGASQGQYGNITESNPTQTVYAYSSGSYDITNQKSSQHSNLLYAEIYGFAANPLYNNDANFDYYIFDVFMSTTSNSSGGWYVDSAGLSSQNGPSFNFTAYICNSLGGAVLIQNIWPAAENDVPANSPQTTSVDLSYGGLSIGISRTFTPPVSQTKPISQITCTVGWASASNYNDNPAQVSYSYNFAFGMKVQKGQPAIVAISATGAFYRKYGCYLILTCTETDHPILSFSNSFSPPPTTTITSSPATGSGFVTVDGVPVSTPAQFVWNEGNVHTIGASPSPVAGGVGTRYVFKSWSDGNSQSHNVISPTVRTTLVANFQTQYELNITVAQPLVGTTSPPPGSYWYDSSTTTPVSAISNNGYELRGWTLDGSNYGISNPTNVMMNSPHSLVASFTAEPTLTVSAGLGGTVTVQSAAIGGGVATTISTGSSQTFPVPSGSSVTLTASPQNPYLFGNWTGTQFYSTNPIVIIVNSNTQETANFVLPLVAVTFAQRGLGPTTSGVVLIVDGSSYGLSSLPMTFQWVVGSSHDFSWAGNFSGGVGTRYIWRSTSGFTTAESGRLTVPTGGGTITAVWGVQYQVTFQVTGLDSTALGTILAVGQVSVPISQFPYNVWADASSVLNATFTRAVPSSTQNNQFDLSGVSVPLPTTVSGPVTVVASYSRQTLATSITSVGTGNPSPTSSSVTKSSSSSAKTSSSSSNTSSLAETPGGNTSSNQSSSAANSTNLVSIGLGIVAVVGMVVAGLIIRRKS